MRRNGWAITTMVLVGALSGCGLFGSSEGADAGSAGIGEPDWLERGDALVVDGDNRYFAGVGAARGKLRESLLKTAAKKKAKDSVEKPLKAWLNALATPWLDALDAKTKKANRPDKMLDALLKRVVKLAAVDETYVPGGGKAAFALAKLDLVAVTMEMQASADVEPLLAYLQGAEIDPRAVFDQVASRYGVEEPPPAEEPEEPAPAEGEAQGEAPAEGEEAPTE